MNYIFVAGVAFCFGMFAAISLLALMRKASEHPDTDRLDFLEVNHMSLDCSPDGKQWAVMGAFPRIMLATAASARNVIDKVQDPILDEPDFRKPRANA